MSRRVPPHDLEAEESLLGAMLLATKATETALSLVTAEDFYKPAHSHIYDAICEGHAADESTDPVSVAAIIRARGLLEDIGGPAVLVSLQAHTPSTSGAGTYARIIAEHARRRRMIGLAAEVTESAYAGDDDGITRAVERLGSLPTTGRARLEVEDLTEAIEGNEDAVVPTILEMTA